MSKEHCQLNIPDNQTGTLAEQFLISGSISHLPGEEVIHANMLIGGSLVRGGFVASFLPFFLPSFLPSFPPSFLPSFRLDVACTLLRVPVCCSWLRRTYSFGSVAVPKATYRALGDGYLSICLTSSALLVNFCSTLVGPMVAMKLDIRLERVQICNCYACPMNFKQDS